MGRATPKRMGPPAQAPVRRALLRLGRREQGVVAGLSAQRIEGRSGGFPDGLRLHDLVDHLLGRDLLRGGLRRPDGPAVLGSLRGLD